MKLIITIDTEEDNWDRYSTTENPVGNIKEIPKLQKLFDEFEVKPTYLVTYPVATSKGSIEILKKILEEGKCEIGMHCHPWNTPPFEEEINEFNSMLCNLPERLVHKKLSTLHETICKNFGIVPVSFRAGRFGFGPAVARSLCLLEYQVDTSVTPFVSWEDYQGPNFSEFNPELFNIFFNHQTTTDEKNSLLEVPVTIGFTQDNFKRSIFMMKTLDNKIARKFLLPGLFCRLGLLNRIWLSPEMSDADSMIKLAEQMHKNNYPCLNMTFHSTSLLAGLSKFIHKDKENDFFNNIRKFLMFCSDKDWNSQTLTEFSENISSSADLFSYNN